MDLSFTSEELNYFLRLAGRIGFCILIITIYRFYQIFASPLVKKRHKRFIRIFAVSLLVSLILLIVNYILPDQWFSVLSTSFNVLTTYILTFYLYHQSKILEQNASTEEFKQLSLAMDSLILILKHR